MKPAKIPAPQPEAEARARPGRGSRRRAKAMSKIDMIRAKARGEAVADAAAPRRRRRPKQNPLRRPRPARRSSEPKPGPPWSGLATPNIKELADKINAELGAGDRDHHSGRPARQDRQADRRRPLSPRQEPDQVRLPGELAERPLRRLHRGQLPARQHGQSRHDDRAAGSNRRGRGPGRSPVALPCLSGRRLSGARSLRHDGGPLSRAIPS